MIGILFRDGEAAPIVICDMCSDMIGEAVDGIVVFPAASAENTKAKALHVHKLLCFDKALGTFPGGAGLMDLGQHLLLLSINTCVDGDAFIKLAKETLAKKQKPGAG